MHPKAAFASESVVCTFVALRESHIVVFDVGRWYEAGLTGSATKFADPVKACEG